MPAIERRGVRLTGVSLSSLSPKDGARQLGLDEPAALRSERVGEAIDQIANKFGRRAVQRAVHMHDDKRRR